MKIIKPHYRKLSGNKIEIVTSQWIFFNIINKLSGENNFIESIEYPVIKNYEDDLEFIIPKWILDLRTELSDTIDPLVGDSRKFLLNLNETDLITNLICMDRSVSLWYDSCQFSEDSFKALVFEDEIDQTKLQDILPGSRAIKIIINLDTTGLKLENLIKLIE